MERTKQEELKQIIRIEEAWGNLNLRLTAN